MTVYYVKTVDRAGNSACNDGFRGIIYHKNCAGKSQDTRGGYLRWSDGNVYGVDPQTWNCNC
jgi:hypothetical protein